MSSLVNTLRRWYSTVRGLMKSWAPISGFVCPSAASRAICASCAVSVVARLDGALAHGLAGRQQLAAGALGERLGPDAAEHLVRGTQLLARVDAPVARDAAIRRTGGGRGRDGRRCGCARAARSPRGRGTRRLGPSLSSARDRASMPSAQSVPAARVRSSSARSAAAATSCGTASGARLDQLDQRPAEETQIVVLAGPLGGGERGLVAAETVVQHGGRVAQPGRLPFPRLERSRLERWRRSASSASASRPRQATSTSEVYLSGAMPAASAIAQPPRSGPPPRRTRRRGHARPRGRSPRWEGR